MTEPKKNLVQPSGNEFNKPLEGGEDQGADHGQDHAQDVVNEETEKGYSGTTNDDGDYSVAGSVAGDNNPDAGKGTP